MEAMIFETPPYDDEQKKVDRDEEEWIALRDRADGKPWSRADALEEAKKLAGAHNGLHLNRDGKTFKIRVHKGQSEKGYEKLTGSKAPPEKSYIIERLLAGIPVTAIPDLLEELIAWKI